jgi:hypothetical protein
LDEREILPKPHDPKVMRIVRYESGTGEGIEIIDMPDPHKAAEYKAPTNDELRPKPGCRFKEKTAIRASGKRNAFIHPSAWKGNPPKLARGFRGGIMSLVQSKHTVPGVSWEGP